MQELSLKEIQQETLKSLKKLDQICAELNINYFLAYGTLIGAIRHNGFIPWDDDIDVFFMRHDLEKLLDYFESNKDSLLPFKINTRKNTKNYTVSIPRLVNTDFIFESSYKYEKPFELGTFIDLYPLDYAGNSQKEAWKLGKKVRKLNKLYIIYKNPDNGKKGLKKLIRYCLSAILNIIWGKDFDFDSHISNMLKACTSQKDSLVAVLYDQTKYNHCDAFDKNLFTSAIKHRFEDFEASIPAEYDTILKTWYGEYITLPPEEQRIPHHNYKIYRK